MCGSNILGNDETLVETEGERIEMDEVHEMKYLGFVMSSDASNVPNILKNKNKSIGIIRSITNMDKQRWKNTQSCKQCFFLGWVKSVPNFT